MARPATRTIRAGGIAAWEVAGFRIYNGVVPSKAFAEVVDTSGYAGSRPRS
jgi:hypothetical protein